MIDKNGWQHEAGCAVQEHLGRPCFRTRRASQPVEPKKFTPPWARRFGTHPLRPKAN